MEMIKITGLWKRTTNKGDMFIAGPLSSSTSIMIFPNTQKRGEKDPDFLMYMSPAKKKEQSDGQKQDAFLNNTAQKFPPNPPKPQQAPEPQHVDDDDDIPF